MNSHSASLGERRVVITGMGTINPLGSTVKEFWDNLKIGKSGIRNLKNVDMGSYHVNIGGEVDFPEDVRDYFRQPKMIRRLDRCITLSHIAGIQAFRDSGLDTEKIAPRCGCIIGTGAGGILSHQKNIYHIHDGNMQQVSPFYLIGAIPSTSAAYLAQEANLQGHSFGLTSACSSSNHAFGLSYSFIKSGMQDVMFAGGTEAALNEMGLTAFGNIMALSGNNEEPEKASRPFDRDRRGFVMGEGAGILCLEEREHARRRGAKIYAEVLGYGYSSDAHDLVAPHPEGAGGEAAIRQALETARLNPEDIDLVNAHGTGTPLGDRIESMAINKGLGAHGSKVMVHSTKSMTGHLLGGAGAIEAIALIMAFSENVVHPSVNMENLDPEVNLNVINEARDGSQVKHVLSNGFGFGGMNAVTIFKRTD